MASSITVLQTSKRRRATKVIRVDSDGNLSIESYDKAKYFTAELKLVSSIEELSSLLTDLEGEEDRLIIRGTPTKGVDLTKKLRRTKHQAGVTELNEYPFVDEPISWMMIDIDSLECPSSIDPISDPLVGPEKGSILILLHILG